MKKMSRRGRKRAELVQCLYKDLQSEFERLRAAGIKLNTEILEMNALMMKMETENGSKFHELALDNGKLIVQ